MPRPFLAAPSWRGVAGGQGVAGFQDSNYFLGKLPPTAPSAHSFLVGRGDFPYAPLFSFVWPFFPSTLTVQNDFDGD